MSCKSVVEKQRDKEWEKKRRQSHRLARYLELQGLLESLSWYRLITDGELAVHEHGQEPVAELDVANRRSH